MDNMCREISREEVARLISEARPTEQRFLLKLETWDKNNYVDTNYVRCIYGVMEQVLLSEQKRGDYQEQEYLIIPKSVPTILREVWTFGDSVKEVLWIFVSTGWKKLTL